MDKATKRLLKQNPELEFLKDKGIVRFIFQATTDMFEMEVET